MIPANPIAEALTRRAFAGVSAYVIVWQGQPVGRVAFREDGGDLRCLLTVDGQEVGECFDADTDPAQYTTLAHLAVLRLRPPGTPDYETDGAHLRRIAAGMAALPYSGTITTWQAALRSAGYDVWQAL